MASGLVSSLLSSARSLLTILGSSPSALFLHSDHPAVSADLQRLERLLSRIQATLDDAEEQEIQDNYVKLWLTELKDLALNAEDVLDDYRYELLRCQVQDRKASSLLKRKHMDHEKEGGNSINKRINEITSRFEEISRDRAALQLRPEDGQRIVQMYDWSKSRPTSHLLDESLVFGRIDEKDSIIESLLSHSVEPGMVVLPIVGMGGIGKTTVAQMVYNDGRVRKHFEHSGWIHVSPTFDIHRLTIAITESLTKRSYSFTQLSLVHEVLLKEVLGKKLFLVLDDLWNECEGYWQDLLYPLRYAQKVTILVTTRSKKVAHLVQTVEPFFLGSIRNDDCWLLFQHYAFGKQHPNEHSSLVQIGRKIFHKCGGLPLSVKSIGCLLRSKTDEYTWMQILESELWELDEKDDIFPALRLSYYQLPTRLKPCFLLCSLYPRYLGFTKDELIHLWIAQGYVHSRDGKTRKEVGDQYFNELQARSLIEISSGQLLIEAQFFDEFSGRSLIESLYNDDGGLPRLNKSGRFLRKFEQPFSAYQEIPEPRYNDVLLQRKYIMMMKESLIETYLEKSTVSIQRFKLHDVIFDLAKSFTSREHCTAMLDTICNVPNELHQLHASKDRKVLSFNDQRSLRTLVLNCCFSACYTELSNFVHLRALVLNSNKGISNMVYSIGNLKHLRHLTLNCNLQELPESVSRLYSLETLVISSLKTLRASIFHNLVSLRCLHVSFDFMDGPLDRFSDLSLDTLCLKHCSNITGLPLHIGSLINLQQLQLVGVSNLKNLDHASFRHSKHNSITWQPEVIFPSLEELELENLCKLEEWYRVEHSDCPKLKSLTIKNCSKLRRIPYFASLRKLVISKTDVKILPFSGNVVSKLVTLDIRDCLCLSSLVGLQNLPYIITLYIARCPRLLIHPSEIMACKPPHVFIADCPQMKQWCNTNELNYFQVTRKMKISDIRLIIEYGVENFMAVEHLTIEKCSGIGPKLLCSSKSWLPSELRFLQFSFSSLSGVLHLHKDLVMLSRLEIRSCPKLDSLLGLHALDGLRLLFLVDCPLLDLSPETKFPEQLSCLVIRGCHKLQSLHLLMNDPSFLRELEISDCRGLMYIGGLNYYTELEGLTLSHCPLLQLRGLMPAVPETAVICCCPRLKKWCERHGVEHKDQDQARPWASATSAIALGPQMAPAQVRPGPGQVQPVQSHWPPR